MIQTAPSHNAQRSERPSRLERLANRRFAGLPSWVVLVELFIGFGWLRAAVEKAIDPDWWNGVVIADFAAAHSRWTIVWFQPVIDHVVLPHVRVVAAAVVLGQLVAAATLIAGRRRGVGLATGTALCVSFIAAGAVNPAIFYLVTQSALALWLLENRIPPERALRILRIGGRGAVIAAALTAPFISTLRPARIVEDAAAVFAFGALLVAVACAVGSRHAATRFSEQEFVPLETVVQPR